MISFPIRSGSDEFLVLLLDFPLTSLSQTLDPRVRVKGILRLLFLVIRLVLGFHVLYFPDLEKQIGSSRSRFQPGSDAIVTFLSVVRWFVRSGSLK
jgi:hypothetical protein